MNEPAILIPCTALLAFSAATRDEILTFVGLQTASVASVPSAQRMEAGAPMMNDDGPPDFTVAMCRKLIADPINPKTATILRVIAESPTPEFHIADCIKAIPGANISSDLRGSWSGITRRARKILADTDAEFIWWDGEPVHDQAGNNVDQVGRISPLTHQSLRVALGVRDAG